MAADMAVVTLEAGGMAAAEIGTALVGMAAQAIGTAVEAAGMRAVVIGAAAGTAKVVAGIIMVTVAAGELDPR